MNHLLAPAYRLFFSLSLFVSVTAFVFIGAGTAFSQSETPQVADSAEQADDIEDLLLISLSGGVAERQEALQKLVARGNLDVVPALVLFMRIGGEYRPMGDALTELTGVKIETWRDAMIWQEAHPEVVPHESYRAIKLRFFANIDPKFLQFFDAKLTSREQMKIRFEEITWGGVRVDGIPSLDSPKLIKAEKADYLLQSDLVFGVEINGDVRAYPLRIMGWHEMFNEVIGGVPVALAYCTLCGAGILFETDVEGHNKPFVFGSSGFLYRSNKLMFDRKTNTLWNQFTGEPVVGELVDSGIKLKIRPVTITSWEAWRKQHPDTKVLSLKTGHRRDYGPGVVYNEYFSSPELMFPAIVRDESQLKRKDFVFGIREFGAAKAWPIEAFRDKRVINDKIGVTDVVLIGDASTRTVRAYQRGNNTFRQGESPASLLASGTKWQVTEDFLLGSDGSRLARVPGHIAYWFAWDGYLGLESELYSG